MPETPTLSEKELFLTELASLMNENMVQQTLYQNKAFWGCGYRWNLHSKKGKIPTPEYVIKLFNSCSQTMVEASQNPLNKPLGHLYFGKNGANLWAINKGDDILLMINSLIPYLTDYYHLNYYKKAKEHIEKYLTEKQVLKLGKVGATGSPLAKWRVKNNLTLQEVANSLNLSKVSVCYLENGKIKLTKKWVDRLMNLTKSEYLISQMQKWANDPTAVIIVPNKYFHKALINTEIDYPDSDPKEKLASLMLISVPRLQELLDGSTPTKNEAEYLSLILENEEDQALITAIIKASE